MSGKETERASGETINASDKLRVLYVEPGKHPRMVEIEDSLKAMQELVGGMIEEYTPFEDEVSLICNDEGKMLGLPFNRGIRDEKGELMDCIAGDFFLCYAPIGSEDFLSLPEDLAAKYEEKFRYPEILLETKQGLTTRPYVPESALEKTAPDR